MQSLRSLHPSNSYHERWCDEWGRTTWKVFPLKSQGCPCFKVLRMKQWIQGKNEERTYCKVIRAFKPEQKTRSDRDEREREWDQVCLLVRGQTRYLDSKDWGRATNNPEFVFLSKSQEICSCILFKILSSAKMWARPRPPCEDTDRNE